MARLIHMLPIFTTLGAIGFAFALFKHWRNSSRQPYLGWWAAGMLFYALGALAESLTTLWGWHEPVFRAWYIFGALLGAAPLAQGTVYLVMPRAVAHRLTAMLLGTLAIAMVCVLKTPINYPAVNSFQLSGRVMEWQWVRNFSPFINLYALFFLSGGALYSAWLYWFETESRARFMGNLYIAAGAALPGIGGTLARYGHVGWLYLTELLALALIWHGYCLIKNDPGVSVHDAQPAR